MTGAIAQAKLRVAPLPQPLRAASLRQPRAPRLAIRTAAPTMSPVTLRGRQSLPITQRRRSRRQPEASGRRRPSKRRQQYRRNRRQPTSRIEPACRAAAAAPPRQAARTNTRSLSRRLTDRVEIDDGTTRCRGGKADRTGHAAERARRPDAGAEKSSRPFGRRQRRYRADAPLESPPSDHHSGPNSASMSAAPIRSTACARCGAACSNRVPMRACDVASDHRDQGKQQRALACSCGWSPDRSTMRPRRRKFARRMVENQRPARRPCSTANASR